MRQMDKYNSSGILLESLRDQVGDILSYIVTIVHYFFIITLINSHVLYIQLA